MIALAAAYALALGGILASWAAGSAAALAADAPASVTCHSDGAGGPPPSPDGDSGHVCVDACCVGCVLLIAALPPPPIKSIGAPQSAARPVAASPARSATAGHFTRSHRSRAPPLRA